jgi:hypothetical protein
MLTQIFKKNVPPTLLTEVLEKVCLKTEKYYLVDLNAYRKLLYYKLDESFGQTLVEYYHVSKQFYATRKMTYNSFTNIIRQICKSNNVMFTSNIRYNESKYNIDYFIYF